MSNERQKITPAERTKAWRLANPERVKELAKEGQRRRKERWGDFLAMERERYRQNAERKLAAQRAARALDTEKFRERVRQSYRNAPHKAVANCAMRRAVKEQATPAWVSRRAVAAIYEDARRLTTETGVPHEVDHIVPLRARGCCGLHVPWNLRVVTRLENRRKFNKLTE